MPKALRAVIRTPAVVVIVVLGGLACAGIAAGASSGTVPRCEKITVKGKRWGVYVDHGKVGCATAAGVLRGVLAGKGKDVDKGPADEYLRYDGWVCPYFQMGVVSCDYGTKPVKDPSRVIFGLSCATDAGGPGCPARGET